MSNNSETVSKKAKRGRPKVFEPGELSIARMAAPDAKSERTVRNAAWAQIGLRLFLTGDSQPKNPQELGFDGSFIFDVKTDIFKKTILTELGRLCVAQGEDVALEVAKVICNKRMRARDAVARIRQLRGTSHGGGCLSLTDRLVKTVNDYLAEHPETTWAQVRGALANASDLIDESANK